MRATFLPQAERALGFPIDVIGGHEEARLIYLGVAHVLPPSDAPRLVIDIGGGSTEFIIGRGLEPERLESLKLGCVSMTQRFFPDGDAARERVRRRGDRARASRSKRSPANSAPSTGSDAYASSGTALALAEILEQNGLSAGGITPDGLARLRKRMIARRPHPARLHARRRSSPSARRCWPAASPSWRGGGRARRRAHQSGRRRAAPGRALRPARPHRRRATPRSSPSSASSSATTSTAARAARRRDWRARFISPRCARRRPRSRRSCCDWAALLHEIGYVGVAHRLSQARRVHPRSTPTCRASRRRSSARLALLVCGCRGGLSKIASRARRSDRARAGAGAAPRRAVPSRATERRRCRASR